MTAHLGIRGPEDFHLLDMQLVALTSTRRSHPSTTEADRSTNAKT